MIFFTILTIVIFLAHNYIGWRLIAPSRFGAMHKRVAWTVLLFFPLLLPLSFLLQLTTDNSMLSDILGWITYPSLGFFSLLFGLLVLRDAVWVITSAARQIVTLFRRISRPGTVTGDGTFDIGRRNFLIQSMNLSIIGVSALLTGYGTYEARRRATVVEVSIPLSNLPPEFDGFRIVQISDIHAGPTLKRPYVQMITDQVNLLGADLIAFTGDLADGSVKSLQKEVAPLKDLYAPWGKFFVTGNHEYYSGAEAWIEEVDRIGFTVLLNENHIIGKDSGQIVLAGVTDSHGGRFIREHASDPKAALLGAPEDSIKILMAHQPRSIYSAAEEGYDLQISGHTHGGQYVFGTLIIALSQPYLKGLHRHDDTWIYINSGTGYWGPPLRLCAPSEITVITLTTT